METSINPFASVINRSDPLSSSEGETSTTRILDRGFKRRRAASLRTDSTIPTASSFTPPHASNQSASSDDPARANPQPHTAPHPTPVQPILSTPDRRSEPAGNPDQDHQVPGSSDTCDRSENSLDLLLTNPCSLEACRPPNKPNGNPNIIFISEIIPRNFNRHKRAAILDIFQSHARYIPACVSLNGGKFPRIRFHPWRLVEGCPTPGPSRPLGPGGQGWPKACLPLEVFENIAQHLSRDSLHSMRLVNREFEQKVSNILFHTVVVPFREEIYGMMLEKSKNSTAVPSIDNLKDDAALDAPSKVVHDGMKVFQAWGPNIKKFAMAFEVDEVTLERPPLKGKFQIHPTFWGDYRWPHPYYNRFEACEGLEKKADEFRCMSEALSNLSEVRELALSVDSGLGFLNGPDLSDRARLFRKKPEIFGKKHDVPDLEDEEREEIWQGIRHRALLAKTLPKPPFPQTNLDADWQSLLHSTTTARMYIGSPRNQIMSERPLIFDGVELEDASNSARTPVIPDQSSLIHPFHNLRLVPRTLTTAQQEWLLETEWAQRAFLSSFCMALCDNTTTFQNVKTLNLARISSRYLTIFDRADVWRALINLEGLTIKVVPDWRNIQKTESGLVESASVEPSRAAALFYALLRNQICGLQAVKSLHLGYIGGGEHQPGIHGRNSCVQAAPLLAFDEIMESLSVTLSKFKCKTMLTFPHVHHLTLSNCYFTPRSLEAFVDRMRSAGMKSLDLNSVSLTARSLRGSAQYEKFNSDQVGFTEYPHGRPRYRDPAVGNFFELRSPSSPMPTPNTWTNNGLRIGSWGEIINRITPGADLDLVRYAFCYYDRSLYEEIRSRRSKLPSQLRRITFDSCGYILLSHPRIKHHPGLPSLQDNHPVCLRQRATDLAGVSMFPSNEAMLGDIVTELPDGEESVLRCGFGFDIGWKDQLKAKENLEDGQPEGGSGRFSGTLERLTFKDLD